MKILVNSSEMRQCDTNTIDYFKVPSLVLMERAALSVVNEIEQRKLERTRCLVVCGLGNNGGDGLAIARMLYQKGSNVTVVCDMNQGKATEQTKQQYAILKQYNVPVVPSVPGETYDLIIDAMFGIGLSREITGYWKDVIEDLNKMDGFKLSVDIPSGINSDNGQIMGAVFRADMTVTFAYEKAGLLLYPGYIHAGTIVTTDIGIDQNSWRGNKPKGFSLEKQDLSMLPERSIDSNKGTFGRVLVIAGKENMAGAAFFSAKAAAVTGCGLVKIMTEEANRIIIQQLMPEAILETYTKEEVISEEFARKLNQALCWADAVVLGPGLGTTETASRVVQMALNLMVSPVIIDADALNIIAKKPLLLQEFKGKAIITPHLGEMARLTEKTVDELKKDILSVAGSYARDYNVICVLKDARTVTALEDGKYYINTSGNQGMATAGSGDVLAGVIAGLIAQKMSCEMAAPFGVFLHGMAGDCIAKETGYYGMLATDIIQGMRQITRKESYHEYL